MNVSDFHLGAQLVEYTDPQVVEQNGHPFADVLLLSSQRWMFSRSALQLLREVLLHSLQRLGKLHNSSPLLPSHKLVTTSSLPRTCMSNRACLG
jgi:hypothetical protein